MSVVYCSHLINTLLTACVYTPIVLHNLKTRFLDSNIIYTYCGEQCLHNNVFINQGEGFCFERKVVACPHIPLTPALTPACYMPHVHSTYLLLLALGCLLLLALGYFSFDASVLPTLGHYKQLLSAN